MRAEADAGKSVYSLAVSRQVQGRPEVSRPLEGRSIEQVSWKDRIQTSFPPDEFARGCPSGRASGPERADGCSRDLLVLNRGQAAHANRTQDHPIRLNRQAILHGNDVSNRE